jgi:hypothetical protein
MNTVFNYPVTGPTTVPIGKALNKKILGRGKALQGKALRRQRRSRVHRVPMGLSLPAGGFLTLLWWGAMVTLEGYLAYRAGTTFAPSAAKKKMYGWLGVGAELLVIPIIGALGTAILTGGEEQ